MAQNLIQLNQIVPIDLNDLNDVDTTGLSTGDVIYFDGGGWVDIDPSTLLGSTPLTTKLTISDSSAGCNSPTLTIQGPSAPVFYLQNTGTAPGAGNAPAILMYNADLGTWEAR